MDAIATARKVFDTEINAMSHVRDGIGDTFRKILDCIIECQGKVIITGMGKSGHIARKIAATMSSLGTAAFFLHPAEAMHGDLGMIQKNDVVIVISTSGESTEVTGILPSIRVIGAVIIGLTSNPNSTLAKSSELVEVFPSFDEACLLGLAPTSSTTALMAYGDALAVVASEVRCISDREFGLFHPAGSLGKKLIYRVNDLMRPMKTNECLYEDALLKDAIILMNRIGSGILPVVNYSRELVGILTDGLVEREILKRVDIYSANIGNLIKYDAICINSDAMAVEALKIMTKNSIVSMPVLKDERVVGIIETNAVTNIGIYL